MLKLGYISIALLLASTTVVSAMTGEAASALTHSLSELSHSHPPAPSNKRRRGGASSSREEPSASVRPFDLNQPADATETSTSTAHVQTDRATVMPFDLNETPPVEGEAATLPRRKKHIRLDDIPESQRSDEIVKKWATSNQKMRDYWRMKTRAAKKGHNGQHLADGQHHNVEQQQQQLFSKNGRLLSQTKSANYMRERRAKMTDDERKLENKRANKKRTDYRAYVGTLANKSEQKGASSSGAGAEASKPP